MGKRSGKCEHLPVVVEEYIRAAAGRIGLSWRVRREVAQELADHFTDALASVVGQVEREQVARRLIAEFGDPKLLGVLMRRAKRRCRPAWRRGLIRLTQAAGILILFWLANAAYLYLLARPTIRTDSPVAPVPAS